MTGRRFENFSKRVNERLSEDPPADGLEVSPTQPDEPEEADPPEAPEKENEMSEETPVEQTDAYQAGFKAANDRINAVFAHENTTGREAHAARLIGRASLSADEVVAELAHFPKAEQLSEDQQQRAAEAGGRAEMLSAMEEAGNADLGADRDTDASTSKRRTSARWDKANAKIESGRKEN